MADAVTEAVASATTEDAVSDAASAALLSVGLVEGKKYSK